MSLKICSIKNSLFNLTDTLPIGGWGCCVRHGLKKKNKENLRNWADKLEFTAKVTESWTSPESCVGKCDALQKTHCLLRKARAKVEVVARIVDVGVARVESFVLLLLGHLLDRQEPVLPHLDPLRHVSHTRVFCNKHCQLWPPRLKQSLLVVGW